MKCSSIRNQLLYCFLWAFLVALVLAQQEKHRMKGNYMDVPVRAGYRIMANDDDGYLEDGIIVKTKGTGYIDSRYRKRYDNQGGLLQPQASQPTPAYFFVQPVASTMMYPKNVVPEIIYGRREW